MDSDSFIIIILTHFIRTSHTVPHTRTLYITGLDLGPPWIRLWITRLCATAKTSVVGAYTTAETVTRNSFACRSLQFE